jgi:uncharacterized protein YjbI with pentapeptide repeats
MNPFTSNQLEFEAQTFSAINYQQQEVAGKTFEECEFVNCTLRETAFKACIFRNCVFRESDLSLGSVLDCIFTATEFRDSHLVGLDWTQANWHQRGFLRTIDFFNCVLNYGTFFGLDLTGINLSECLAKEVDFAEANLTRVNFKATDLSGSRFLHTNLTEADLSGALNYTIAVTSNTLKQAKFSLPEAMSLLYGLDIVLNE